MEQASLHAEENPQTAAGIGDVFELCAEEMAAVDRLIRESLDSNVVLIRQIADKHAAEPNVGKAIGLFSC